MYITSQYPEHIHETSSTTQPTSIGSNFSADVIKRSGHQILFICEYVSSFFYSKLIPNEQAKSIKDALIIMCSELIPKTGLKATIKVDPASAFRNLLNDNELPKHGIILE